MQEITQIEITRQERLLIWLRRNGMTQADIAKKLDFTETTVSRWLKADTIPEKRHEQLVKLGIPEELLPEPLDIAPGPKKTK